MRNFWILLLFLVAGCTNKTNDLDVYNLRGNVSSVKSSVYDAESKFGEIIKGDLDYYGTSLLEFNEDGMLKSYTRFCNDGDILGKSINTIVDGKVQKQDCYDGDGVLEYKILFERDGENLKSRITYDEDGNETDKIIYEYDGDRIKSVTHYSKGELYGKIIYSKFEEFKHIEGLCYDKEGNVDGKVEEKYTNGRKTKLMYGKDFSATMELNENNDYIKSTGCYVNKLDEIISKEDETFYYEYDYDSNKNWIKRISYKGDAKKPYQVIERTIIYK